MSSGRNWPSAKSAQERHGDSGHRDADRGAGRTFRARRDRFPCRSAQQHQDAELRDASIMAFCSGALGIWRAGASGRSREHEGPSRMPAMSCRSPRLSDSLHGLAEQAAGEHEHDDLARKITSEGPGGALGRSAGLRRETERGARQIIPAAGTRRAVSTTRSRWMKGHYGGMLSPSFQPASGLSGPCPRGWPGAHDAGRLRRP